MKFITALPIGFALISTISVVTALPISQVSRRSVEDLDARAPLRFMSPSKAKVKRPYHVHKGFARDVEDDILSNLFAALTTPTVAARSSEDLDARAPLRFMWPPKGVKTKRPTHSHKAFTRDVEDDILSNLFAALTTPTVSARSSGDDTLESALTNLIVDEIAEEEASVAARGYELDTREPVAPLVIGTAISLAPHALKAAPKVIKAVKQIAPKVVSTVKKAANSVKNFFKSIFRREDGEFDEELMADLLLNGLKSRSLSVVLARADLNPDDEAAVKSLVKTAQEVIEGMQGLEL
jgi:hypothetical protein